MKQRGFSIIELMIVLIILSLLLGFGIPSYRDYVKRADRAEGTTTMMNVAQNMERCFTRFSSYNNAGCQVATALGGAGITSENGKYTITGVVTANDYTLTAAPAASDDPECASLTLTAAGVRGVTGTDPVGECW